MPKLRLNPLILASSLVGFVLSAGFVGGCSLFGKDDASGGSSPTSGNGGGAGEGGSAGAAGAGGMSASSSSSGMPVDCSDHTTLNETNCSLIKQDCKSPSEMCVPDIAATVCAFQTGVKGFGATCTDNRECAAGLTCVFSACSPFCCPSAPEAFCGSAKCNVSINTGMGSVFACNLSKACTLFGNDCPENQQCRLRDFDQELALCEPNSGTIVPEGGMCQFANDCDANQICTGAVCRYSCLLADWQTKAPGAGGCPANQTCIKASPNSVNFGTCTP